MKRDVPGGWEYGIQVFIPPKTVKDGWGRWKTLFLFDTKAKAEEELEYVKLYYTKYRLISIKKGDRPYDH